MILSDFESYPALIKPSLMALSDEYEGKKARTVVTVDTEWLNTVARPLRPTGAVPNATLRSLHLAGLRRGLARPCPSTFVYRSYSSCTEILSPGNSGLVNTPDSAISETDSLPPSAKQ
jgi:hypothetical protein